jgi:ribosomal protein S27AE
MRNGRENKMKGGTMANKAILTDERRQNYIKTGGVECPYCGSGDITAMDSDYFGSQQSTRVLCNKCGLYWFDIYTLTDIQEA